MSIEKQQQLAKEFIEQLEIMDPTCILAGGAPRDWFFDKKANDLDFYIYTKHETLSTINLRFKRLGLNAKKIEWNGEGCHYEVMEHLRHVFEGTYKGQTYNIMVMKEPTFACVVSHFGTSVCMAWWKNMEHGVQTTLEFLVSHYTKTIFKKDDYTAKVLHVEKMMQRYPDYKVEDFSNYAKKFDLLCKRVNVYPSHYNLQKELLKRIKS